VSLAESLRRGLAAAAGGRLQPGAARAYELAARTVGAYVARGSLAGSVYATSSLATGEIVPGVSDIDLAVVVRADGRPGLARQVVERRRDRLSRLVQPVMRHIWVAVYEEEELAHAQIPCLALPAQGRDDPTLFFGPAPLADGLELSSRPGMPGRVHTWRLLKGAERRPESQRRSRPEDRLAAWLELQAWWRWAIQACVEPDTPGRASLCVKLVAEPHRILLWLQHGDEVGSRRAVLERALELLPEEGEALEDALCLQRRLSRSPKAPLDRFLPTFVRLTKRVAALLEAETASCPETQVQLAWSGAEELALGRENLETLRYSGGGSTDALPLADWRSLVAPTRPDECFALGSGDPTDPAALAAAARAGSAVAYAALRADNVLILPPSDVYWLGDYRCVHFGRSDPVSFALLEGSCVARYPDHVGWRIEDCAARAVREHQAYMEVQLNEPRWEVEKLGLLMTGARAALLAESIEAGEPTLPLTVTATARALADRLPSARAVAEEAAALYHLHRHEGGPPLDSLIAALRPVVASLLSTAARGLADVRAKAGVPAAAGAR
jgi:hypothetical protein